MGLPQLVKAFYTNKNLPKYARQVVFPDQVTAIGTTLQDGGALTYGIWFDIALPAAITLDTIITGVILDTPDANTATDIVTVDIGITLVLGVLYANGAAVTAQGAAVIAAAHREEVRMEFASDAGIFNPIPLPFPIYVPAGVGIIARFYDVASIGAPDEVNCSVSGFQLFN